MNLFQRIGGRLAVVGVPLLVLIGSGLFAAACSGDDAGSEADRAAVRKAVEEELAAEKAGNVAVYLDRVTDRWLKEVVGASRDEVRNNPDIIKDDNPPTIQSITVSGKTATVDVKGADENAGKFDYVSRATMVNQDGKWRLDALHVASGKVPSGAKNIAMSLEDFAFKFKAEDVTTDKQIVFRTENKGKQPHMMVMMKVPPGLKVADLLAPDSNPEGIENIGGAYLFAPGDKADVVVTEKLAAGRYLLLCFVSDLDDPKKLAGHTDKGMIADFNVK